MIEEEKKEVSFSKIFLEVVNSSEKISSALFIIADFIEPENPLGHSIRSLGADLVKKTFKVGSAGETGNLSLTVREIMSFVRVLETAKLLNLRSAVLLRSELENLLKILFSSEALVIFENKNSKLSLDHIFQNTFIPERSRSTNFAPLSFKGQPSRSFLNKSPSETPIVGKTSLKSFSGDKTLNTTTEMKLPRPLLDDRKTLVIDVLKGETNLTVKDFTKYVKGCSEKTIQRDLAALVALGKVKREGERRWARYSLV